jgi:cell division protein ZapA (FtsZ GTPase activity inhibitor)
MMVMIALTIADELTDANAKLEAQDSVGKTAQDKIDSGIASLLSGLAKRIEDIAVALERP